MITKQPTIEDIYNFDAFITTPGVRDGLLERANSGDPELTTHDTDDGPVVYYNAPHGEEIAVGRPIQLAMGGNAAGRHSDAPMSDIPMALLDMGAATVKGVTQGFLGLPGDMESIAYGIKELFNRGADDSKLGAFIRGMQQQTIMPKTEEVKKWLDANVGQVGGGQNPYESMGEVVAPGGQLKAGKAVAKGAVKASKALAPTAGKMAMDVAEKTGMPVRGLGIVEPSASAAGKATAPVSDTGFYSAVEQAALNIQRKSGTGQAFLNDITKGENVKADEVKWIGLDDFLKGKKNVTREEVQNFIKQNKVDVQEVQLADVKASPVSTENITDYFEETLTPNGDEARGIFNLSFTEKGASEPTSFTAYEMKGGSVELYDNRGNFIDEYRTLTDAREHVINESEFSASQADGNTKFGQWQLPGGENYREILLTMPNTKAEKLNARAEELLAMGRAGTATDADRAEWASIMNKLQPETRDIEGASRFRGMPDYKSSHWDQPNVLAHIRVNDRVDADGKKMLLVEEVQSDWHQAGRDKGYATADISTRLKESEKELEQIGLQIRGLNNRMASLSDADLDEFNKLADERQKLYDRQGVLMDEGNALIDRRNAGVPDAPMKDTWYQLALKRVLKYAADNGYDRIGLTTGSRQAERYNLSKQIDAVTWIPKGDGTYDFEVLKDGATIISKRDADASWLKDNIGKELTQKIVNDQHTDILERSGRRFIEGNDLSVGGEGMKKYYDEVYPQFLQKYGKKWGAKVGETHINLQQDLEGFMPKKDMQVEPVRYIDITPQMRESVGKGQPLFTATGVGAGTAGATMQDKEKK